MRSVTRKFSLVSIAVFCRRELYSFFNTSGFSFFSEQAVDRKQAIIKQGRANKKLMPNKGCRRNKIRKVTSNCKQRRNILTTTEEKKRTHNSRTVYKTNDTLAGPAKTPKELNRNINNKRHELTSQGVGKLCWAPMLDW